MKLSEIDATKLAIETVQTALDRIHSTATGIDLRCEIKIALDVPHEATTLGHAVRVLVAYAQTGAPLDAPLQEYLVTLVGVADEDLDELAEDATQPLGIVVRAAMARDDLEHGRGTKTSWLASLAGVSDSRVRQLVVSGDLRATFGPDGDARVRASDARRWLSGRGINVERQ